MEAKYDKIGITYNTTRKADPYLAERFLYHLQPTFDGVYLDIGCGTGNYTLALQQQGYRFIGIDPSTQMLNIAKSRSNEIDWQFGYAEDTGLPDHVVVGIMASLTIHHWKDLQKAFAEMHRVIKPKGRFVIFTSTPQQMKGYWLNNYFPDMLADSMTPMPPLEKIRDLLQDSGFELLATEKYFVQPDLQDLFLQSGKHRPDLYFNEQVRRGISSFASLGSEQEVASGLLALREDIDTGRIHDIISAYENDEGDYLYVTSRAL